MLRRTSLTHRVGIAVVALAAPLCAGLLTAGSAHAADDPVASAVAALQSPIHHIYIDASAPGQAVVNTEQTEQDIGTADIKLAVLPASALPAKETAPQLAVTIGDQLHDDKAIVIVIVGQKPGAAAGKDTKIPTGTADAVMIDAKTAHAGQFTLANVQATLDQAIATYVEELAASGTSNQTVPTPAGNSNNGKIWAILLVVVLVLLASVLVVRALVLRRNDKREEQHLPAARAEVEALYARLGEDVTTLEPGDDAIARQAHTDASARYTAAGMELEEARSLDELAEARRATIEGLAASRVLRLRLGLEPGKDPASAVPAGPQVIGEQPVTVAGASYIGHAVYMPGSPFYFAGGWYQGAWVPGGWFSEPFWEAFDIPELVVGGFGGWGTPAEEPTPAATEEVLPPPAQSQPYATQPIVSDAPTTEVLAQPLPAEPSFASPAAATPPAFAASATEEIPAASGLWGSSALGHEQVGAGMFDTGAFETLPEPEPVAAPAPVAEPAATPEPPAIAMPQPYQPLARPAGADAATHDEELPAEAGGWAPPAAEPAVEYPLTDAAPAAPSEPAAFGWPSEPTTSEPAPAAVAAAEHVPSAEPLPVEAAAPAAQAPADPWTVHAAPAADATPEPVVAAAPEPPIAEPTAFAPPEPAAPPIDIRPPLETPAPYMPISTFFADQSPPAAAPQPPAEAAPPAFEHADEPVAPPLAEPAAAEVPVAETLPVEVPDSALFAPVQPAEAEPPVFAVPAPAEPEPLAEPEPAAELEPAAAVDEAPARAFGRGGEPPVVEPAAAEAPAAEPVVPPAEPAAASEPEPVAAQPEPAEPVPAAAAEPDAHPEPPRERVAAANGWGGEDWGAGDDWGSAWGGSDWTASESGTSSGGW